ncbi:hypothetical protein FRC11_013642, partial [Ceratobasidium sp. 423]
ETIVSTRDAGPSNRKKRALEEVPESSKVKKINKIKGKLSGMLSLPIEVFTEIMKCLALPDVLSVSRSNRFFRKMLMTRSATTLNIWRGAVENVPGLPPCPASLCEPQYAALIYTKYCSMCGTRIVKDMDPYLNVRICKDCVEIHVTHVDRIDRELQPLVPRSGVTRMKASRYGMKTCLIRDVEEAQRWYNGITESSSLSFEELEIRFEERFDGVLDRLEHAKQLEGFLNFMTRTRGRGIDWLKEEWRQDIKRRLEDAGWEEPDWIFPEFVARKWSLLVEAPQPLTDRAWQKLYPSMVPYLEQNRRSHTERSKFVRKGKRLRRMRRLLLGIRNQSDLFDISGEDVPDDEDEPGDDSPDITADQNTPNDTPSPSEDEANNTTEDESDRNPENPAPSAPIMPCARVRIPFPPMVDLLKWPIISDLLTTDTDADTMQEDFEELRDEIEAQIRSWASGVEEELVEILEAGSTDTGSSSDVPQLRLRTGKTLGGLTPTARLLRADSVFCVSEDDPLVAPMPLYFPELFSVLQARPNGYCAAAFKRLDGHKRPKHGYTWDPSEVQYYPEGSTAARALLKQLGRVDAAQFELQALGARFTCGSCGDKWPRSWNEMVQHYAETIVHANMAENAKASIKKRVKYNNVHALDLKTKKKALLILHSVEEAKVLSSKRRKFENLVGCNSCGQLGIDFQSPRDVMLKHVRAVHSIKAPKTEHYARTYGVRKHVKVSDTMGNISDSTEETDQEFVKGIIVGYPSYGTCVFWSDYSRHADSWRWRDFFEKGMY